MDLMVRYEQRWHGGDGHSMNQDENLDWLIGTTVMMRNPFTAKQTASLLSLMG